MNLIDPTGLDVDDPGDPGDPGGDPSDPGGWGEDPGIPIAQGPAHTGSHTPFPVPGQGIDWLNWLFGPPCLNGPAGNPCIFGGTNGPFPTITGCLNAGGGAVLCTDASAVTDCDNGGGETQPTTTCAQAYLPPLEKIKPQDPKYHSQKYSDYASCVGIRWVDSAIGSTDSAEVAVAVNVAPVAKILLPRLLPGPGWVYTALAGLYDAATILKAGPPCYSEVYGGH
jgi:hypothetical protein